MVPDFDYPHYAELRPREPRNKKDELLAAAFFVIVVTLLALALGGCVSTSRQSRVVVTAESPFDLRLSPPIAFSGAAVRITCYVPESLGRGVIRLALEGVSVRGPSAIEHAQNSLLVERLECGTWKATCTVAAEGGRRFAERVLEVKGGMCEGGGSR